MHPLPSSASSRDELMAAYACQYVLKSSFSSANVCQPFVKQAPRKNKESTVLLLHRPDILSYSHCGSLKGKYKA